MKSCKYLSLQQMNFEVAKSKAKIIFLTLVMSLSGCSYQKKRAELESYVSAVKSRTIKEIEPLPEMKPFESFTYKSFNKRSPFSPPEEIVVKNATLNGLRPDANRRKEILEGFPLDSLRMVGTVEKDGKRWALIMDNKGIIHRITKGNYLGQHEGKVDEITEEKVVVKEIVPDPNVGWQERKSLLTLVETTNTPVDKNVNR